MDGTVPSCLDDYGHPTFFNGPCNECEWREVCEKAAKMRKKLEGDTSQ